MPRPRTASEIRAHIKALHEQSFDIRSFSANGKNVGGTEEVLTLAYNIEANCLVLFRNISPSGQIKLYTGSFRFVYLSGPGTGPDGETVILEALRPLKHGNKHHVYAMQFVDWVEAVYFEDFLLRHGPKQLVLFNCEKPPFTKEERAEASLDLEWLPDSRDSNEMFAIIYKPTIKAASASPSAEASSSGEQTSSNTGPAEHLSVDLTED